MKFLSNPYHYLYMKVYLSQYKARASYSDVNFNTCIGLTLAMMLNAGTIVILASKLCNFPFIKDVPKFSYGLLMFLWFGFNYFYFSFRGRYKKILEDFNFESEKEKPKCDVPGVIYLWGSVLVLMVTGFVI